MVDLYGNSLPSDIDECAEGTDTCDSKYADCVDTDGNYTCHCHTGYTGDGETCCMPYDSQFDAFCYLISLI